jgi:hypothetical protein
MWKRSVKAMSINERLENMIRQDLQQKAGEVEPSDMLLSKIIRRIETDEGGNRNMLRDRISNFSMRRWITISVCVVLVLMGVMFTFSEDVRAATLEAIDTIKTIFVLDRSATGEYTIVEKTTEDVLFYPGSSRSTDLSDEELTEKIGFQVHFPEKLNDEFYLSNKTEAVGLNKKVSQEVGRKLSRVIFNAIKDETVYDSLAEYKPTRYVSGDYVGKQGTTILISMQSADFTSEPEDNSKAIETTVGNCKALWREWAHALYPFTQENGIGSADMQSKPDKILKGYILTWNSNGIHYNISFVDAPELTMEKVVHFAEQFMAAQE